MTERRRSTDEVEAEESSAQVQPVAQPAKTAATQAVEKLIVAIEQELAKRESSDALAKMYSALDQFKAAHRLFEASNE